MNANECAQNSAFDAKISDSSRKKTVAALLHCSGSVSWAQLADSVEVFGHEYVRNVAERDDCLLLGEMQVRELEPGLLLYRTQVVDQCDIRTSNALRPSLKLLILLDGCMQVRYGKQWLLLDATHGPRGLLVNLVQEDVFMRQWKKGRQERKLLISCSPDWLSHKGLPSSVPWLQQHLATSRWQPSRKAVALAEQLHHETEQYAEADSLRRLSWQAKAQALLVEALDSVRSKAVLENSDTDAPKAMMTPLGLSVQAYRNLVALREWMATPASDGWGLPEVARHAGMSATYLRRHFSEVAQGQSVAQFLRSQRLLRASQALERDGVSVLRAADIAGYRSVTHFAKAFRQAYGCAPSQWRTGA